MERRMAGGNIKREKALDAILSVIIFLAVFIALYYSFIGLGINAGEAVIEAPVITSAIITPIVLYLFGRTWKKEIKK